MAEALKVERQVQRGLRSSLVSIAANFSLAMCKCVAGVFGHSFVLVADGIESLADVLSSSAVYFGLRVAIKPPVETPPEPAPPGNGVRTPQQMLQELQQMRQQQMQQQQQQGQPNPQQ